MTNKYKDMPLEQIKTHWQDFANLISMAYTQQLAEINVLPEEAWALSRCISEFFHLYKIGVQFQVFPLRKELVDGSVFHAIILELKDAYENDKMVTLDRQSYTEFALCVDDLRQYAKISMTVAGMNFDKQPEDGV